MGKATKLVEVEIDKLIPYANNAKTHDTEQVEKLKASIETFGFISPCLIDKDLNIIAGHGRVMAAREAGMLKVPCLYIEGLTEEERKAYIIADNKLTEMGGWNDELLRQELKDLQDANFDIGLTGFSIDDIGVDDVDFSDIDTEPVFETQEEGNAKVEPGQVWQLGPHRLMCGDSTKEKDVAKLIGEDTVDLFLTDPPYNVDYEGTAGKIENDKQDESQFLDFLIAAFSLADQWMKPGACFYIWHPDGYPSLQFRAAIEQIGWPLRENLIWVKNSLVLSRQDYHWRHEPCLYGWKEGAGHYFIDDRSQDTVKDISKNIDNMTEEEMKTLLHEVYDRSSVIYENKPTTSELHPTMKPVNLFKRLIINSSREGETVLDLFAGSGTTLIACEQTNRRALCMEYDPKYAASIIDRYEQLTGKKAVLIKEKNHGKKESTRTSTRAARES